MPGHGGGPGLPPEAKHAFAGVAGLDLTELPALDDLHDPHGAVREAQELAAQIWHARKTFYLVNGSSAGILAMLLSACAPGDEVIVPRNAHGAVYSGLILSGAVPRYIPVAELDGFPLNVTVEAVRKAFELYPAAKALFLTSPSYFGITADTAEIARIAHERGAMLLLDEAHGAHLGFCPDLPIPGGEKADVRVQSWHKTLGALTPGAALHLHGARADSGRLQECLRWVQTSSPSYPVLLSLDAVRKRMALAGRATATRMADGAGELRASLAESVPLLTREDVRKKGFDLDITRITVLAGKAGISAADLARLLSEKRVDTELTWAGCLLLVVGPGYEPGITAAVAAAFAETVTDVRREVAPDISVPPFPEAVMTPREAALRPWDRVTAEEAIGNVAAASVVSFPPGIPALAPGERVTAEIVDYLYRSRLAGLTIRGMDAAGKICICR